MKTFFLLFIQYTRHLRVVDELFNEKNIQINWLSQNKRRRAQHTEWTIDNDSQQCFYGSVNLKHWNLKIKTHATLGMRMQFKAHSW